MRTSGESIRLNNGGDAIKGGEAGEIIVCDETARRKYGEKWEQAVAGMNGTPGMTEAGMQRYLEALESLPHGHIFFGSWSEELYDRGLRPHAAGETIIIGPAHDRLGELIEGQVNLALIPPKT